jgi:hypothetical protein
MSQLAVAGFLLGAGLGGFLTWIRQTAVRKRLLQNLESELDQALFGGLRRQKAAAPGPRTSSGLTRCSAQLETISTVDILAAPDRTPRAAFYRYP